jgi:hypothetical protein
MHRDTKKILFAGILITLIICSLITWILTNDSEYHSNSRLNELHATTTVSNKSIIKTDSLNLKTNPDSDNSKTNK